MAKKEEIYPEGYPRQKESFSDAQKFKFDVFEAIREIALETTEKSFEDKGYKKQEGAAGEYGTGEKYGAGTSLAHFNVRLSSRPNTNTYFEKIIYFGGKKAISDVTIGWDAKNKAIELAYKTSEFGAFRGYHEKTSYDGAQLINDRSNFVIDSIPAFKKELKKLFKDFADREVAYITSTKIGIEDKTNKSINSMVENSMKKFSIKDLMTSSNEDLSNTVDNYINEGKEKEEKKDDDKVRMNNPEVIAANSSNKLLFDDLSELEEGEFKTAAKNKLKKFGVVAVNELKPSEKKTYFEELAKELAIKEEAPSFGAINYNQPSIFKKGGDLNLQEREKFEKTPYAQGQKAKPHVEKTMKEGDTFWTTVELNPGSGYVPKGMQHNFEMGAHAKNTDKNYPGKAKKINEAYVGGVDYDNTLVPELKAIVGDLNKITPYVLSAKWSPGENIKVHGDNKGGVVVYSNGKLVYKSNSIEEFLSTGINYKAMQLKENLIKRKFSSLNENEEKGINKRYIVTEQRTKAEEENRWKKLAMFESNETINREENIIEECGCADIESSNGHEVTMDMGQSENEREFMQRNSDAEVGSDNVDGREVVMVAKPGSLSNAMFKVFKDDYLNEGKAYIKDLNSGNLVANPNFKNKK